MPAERRGSTCKRKRFDQMGASRLTAKSYTEEEIRAETAWIASLNGGRGAETFCYWQYGAGGRLASCIQSQLVTAMQAIDPGYQDRGVKERKNLCVLRETYMPAALVELGFIDSEDVRLLKEHQEDMARAVARGVTDYLQESLEGIKN